MAKAPRNSNGKCKYVFDIIAHCSREENSVAGMRAAAKKKDRDYYEGAIQAFVNVRQFAVGKYKECLRGEG